MIRSIQNLLSGSLIHTFIFQILKVTVTVDKLSGQLTNLDNNPSISEVAVIYLATNPESVNYTFSSRTATGLTKSGKAYVEEGGLQIGQASMKGTMGKESRVVNALPKSGDQRLREFREVLFKLSHAISSNDLQKSGLFENRIQLNDFLRQKIRSFHGGKDGGDTFTDEYFAVNFYDFFQRVFHRINLTRFDLFLSVQREGLPDYQIDFELLDVPLRADTNNPYLLGLSKTLQIFEEIENRLSSADSAILSNPFVSGALNNAALGFSFAELAAENFAEIKTAFSASTKNRRVIELNPLGSQISNFIGSL